MNNPVKNLPKHLTNYLLPQVQAGFSSLMPQKVRIDPVDITHREFDHIAAIHYSNYDVRLLDYIRSVPVMIS